MNRDPNELHPKAGTSGLRWGIGISIFFAFALVVLGFVAWLDGYQSLRQGGQHLADLASFGSYLQGAVASFWSLAGVFLILVAFLVQKQQLQYQREELELTRGDLKEQQRRLDEQERITNRQNFEAAFFQLLNLQNQIASQMRQPTNDSVTEGRGCFKLWHSNLRASYQDFLYANKWKGNSELERVREFYEVFFIERDHQEDLAHYFRTLYHLIKFVKFSEVIPTDEKRRYTSLVRAQLSAYEVAHLFYNGLTAYAEGFKPWIEEFGLLEHFNRYLLLAASHESLYDPKAFK
jgi:hypothetical protein